MLQAKEEVRNLLDQLPSDVSFEGIQKRNSIKGCQRGSTIGKMDGIRNK